MSNTISAGDMETAAVTFIGTFLTDVAVFGGTLVASAELAAIAALGVVGYHYISGNISPAPAKTA